jgi:hypothetical protein
MAKKMFTQKEVICLLVDFDQALNPENYESSKDLICEDFSDAAICAAQALGLEKELEAAIEIKQKENKNG